MSDLAAGRLLLGDFDHFASVVLSAVRADAVRQAILMTAWAFGEGGLL